MANRRLEIFVLTVRGTVKDTRRSGKVSIKASSANLRVFLDHQTYVNCIHALITPFDGLVTLIINETSAFSSSD